MELAANVILIILIGIGAALFFVGSLIVVVTAFGHKQYREKGAYASKFLISGVLLVAISYGLATLFYKF